MSVHGTCSNTVSSCDFQAIDSIHQVGVYCLALVPANTLPKTPLGGIHLSETKQLFLEGSLHPCNVLMCPHTCVTNLPKPRQKQPGMPRGWEGSCGVSGGTLQPVVVVPHPLGLVNGGDSQLWRRELVLHQQCFLQAGGGVQGSAGLQIPSGRARGAGHLE